MAFHVQPPHSTQFHIHLNTGHPNTGFIWKLDTIGVRYSNGEVTWFGRLFEYQIFWTIINCPVFKPPFEYLTIWQPDTNLSFEYLPGSNGYCVTFSCPIFHLTFPHIIFMKFQIINANHISCFGINKVLDENTFVSLFIRSMPIVQPILLNYGQ